MPTSGNSWRKFQTDIQLGESRPSPLRRGIRFVLWALLLLCVIIGAALYREPIFSRFTGSDEPVEAPEAEPPDALAPPLNSVALSALLAGTPVHQAGSNRILTRMGNEELVLETGLDTRLQRFVRDQVVHVQTLDRGRPEIIALVALLPDTGRILAMAGHDRSDPDRNPCAATRYPAASIFKLVTAAAALDHCGMAPDTPLEFNGGKYTLYKRQLKEIHNRYTVTTSLADALAQSINPVFGKLGAHEIQGKYLSVYAGKFGFGQPEPPLMPESGGTLVVTDKPYQWAEVASGFNKTTRISPLFGAMITSVPVNGGKQVRPWLVREVTDGTGNVRFQRKIRPPRQVIPKDTADLLADMMTRTISKGTARKAFRRLHKDPHLSGLVIGGKTGSLYNRDHTVKLDWFTGFSRNPATNQALVVSVLVGHGQYIGTRAGDYARRLLSAYHQGG